MKRILIFVGCLLGYFHAEAQQTALPVVKNIDLFASFTNADYDMGKIAAGKPLEYNVTIKNISKKDTLVLQDVKVGCGCTTPKFRAGEKIAPGKSTYIVLGFNGDAHGEFTKTADIIFNDNMIKQVKFRGVTQTDIPAVSNNNR
jgi:hypothetical protein